MAGISAGLGGGIAAGMPGGGMGWPQWIQLFSQLGKAGTAMGMAFQKQGYPPGFAEALAAQQHAQTYMGAAADPSSPYFKNIMEVEEQRQRGDLVTAIQEIIRANLARQGRGAFVNPERRDETVWTALTKGFREAGLRAREMARDQLLGMAGASSKAAAGYAPMMQMGWLTDSMNRANRAAGMGGAFDTTSRIGEWLGSRNKGSGTGSSFWDMFKPGNKGAGTASVPDAYRKGPSMGYDFWGG